MSILYLLPLIVLVPMIPAYVLFKVLESKGELGGPFYGLKLQLGGAFAGYFALLLVLLAAFKAYIVPPPVREVWTFSGTLVDAQNNNPLDVPKENFWLNPNTPPITANKGVFTVSFVPEPKDGGGVKLPVITINYPDYVQETIDLDGGTISGETSKDVVLKPDYRHHEVKISRIAFARADASNSNVHNSIAQPTDGVPEQYQQIGTVIPVAPPPGYAR